MNTKKLLSALILIPSLSYCPQPKNKPKANIIQIIQQPQVIDPIVYEVPKPKPMSIKKLYKGVKRYVQENPVTVAIGAYLLLNTIINGRKGIIGSTIGHIGQQTITQPITDTKFLISMMFNGAASVPCTAVQALIK